MFVLEVPYCDFDLLWHGNQSIRWRKINKGKYIVVDGQKILLMQQRKNKKTFLCSEDDFYSYWYNYFDINFDYYEVMYDVREFAKLNSQQMFLIKTIIKENRRIRILKQDLFETMITYALDEDEEQDFYDNHKIYWRRRNNPKLDKINEITKRFGEKKFNTLGGIGIQWYKFPSIYDIDNNIARCSMLTQDEVKRIKRIIYMLRQNESILDLLEASEGYDETYGLLSTIYDNPNWIKNVMFYSLGFKEAFPVRPSNKKTFRTLNLYPKDFKEFDNIKGLLLEYFKVQENTQMLQYWSKELWDF